MAGFEESHHIDGDEDNFLSASGQSRKQKRASKKAAKQSDLRAKKGTEISAGIANELGIPVMPSVAPKKKGLKGLVQKIEARHDQKQADSLFKKDLKASEKAGTLSKADMPKEKKDYSGLKKTVLGIPALLGFGDNAAQSQSTTKTADAGKTFRYVLIGLGVVALGFIVFSKGMPAKKA